MAPISLAITVTDPAGNSTTLNESLVIDTPRQRSPATFAGDDGLNYAVRVFSLRC
ncbi:hypothetical protein WDV93_01410 [Pantoea ananatis]